jgi:hypothetical protein
MTVYEKLLKVQAELKAPKSQYNSFGKYNYRSCEDILEAVKPICHKYQSVLTLSDDVIELNGRFYVKAIATFVDVETGESVVNNAFAREEDSKKGMDGSQITGTASSYARKYCLNGLFNIDDTKDADTDAYHRQTKQEEKPTEVVYVRRENNCTEVLGNNNRWYSLESMSLELLNKVVNDSKYAQCHDEARRLMMKK